MIFKTKIKLAALVLLMGFNLTNCTDDKKKAEEVVKPSEAPAAATPSVDEASAPVFFAFDDYTLDSSAQASLSKLTEYMKGAANTAVQIEGHCDERGSVEYNLALGQKRAQSVKNYLVQLGIQESRLSTISYGEEKPAAEGHDESAWSKNRRAQFVLSKP